MADKGSIPESNVIREGPLAIKSTGKQSWFEKYVLLDESLNFGKNREECTRGKHRKQYGKHDCFEVTKEDSEDGRFAFSIRTKINSDDKESKILLAASNDDDRERWIKSIKTFSAYYSDEKFECQDEDQRSRSETSGTRDSGYNSRSSQILELPRISTDTASAVPFGEQEEGGDKEEPRTNSEMGELAHDSRQGAPDFSSEEFRPRSSVVTRRTSTITCPNCQGEIDLTLIALCNGSTRRPTENDSRIEGQSRNPSENIDNSLEQ